MEKLRVAVVFGGRSAEHEIGLLSARNVISALDPAKYEPILIGIDRHGRRLMSEASLTEGSLTEGPIPRVSVRAFSAPRRAWTRTS